MGPFLFYIAKRANREIEILAINKSVVVLFCDHKMVVGCYTLIIRRFAGGSKWVGNEGCYNGLLMFLMLGLVTWV